MPTCSDASGAVDVLSDVAFVGNPRRSGMDAYTDADRQLPQSFLRLARCHECPGRGLEGIEEGVTLRVNLHAPVTGEGCAQQDSMLSQGIRIGVRAEPVQKSRRTLDVGEQKGDRPRRKSAHLHRIRLEAAFSKGPGLQPSTS